MKTSINESVKNQTTNQERRNIMGKICVTLTTIFMLAGTFQVCKPTPAIAAPYYTYETRYLCWSGATCSQPTLLDAFWIRDGYCPGIWLHFNNLTFRQNNLDGTSYDVRVNGYYHFRLYPIGGYYYSDWQYIGYNDGVSGEACIRVQRLKYVNGEPQVVENYNDPADFIRVDMAHWAEEGAYPLTYISLRSVHLWAR